MFNEPQAGALGDTAVATQDVLAWQAQVRAAAVAVDPSRAMFVMARAGGLLGLRDADFSVFGDLSGLALDIHSYSTGVNGNDLSADGQAWAPSYDATHNQSSTAYHGSAEAQQQVLQTGIDKATALGIPLLVGEWGALNADSGLATYQAQMLDLFARNGLSWARWQLQDNTFALINSDGSLDAAGQQIARTLLSTPGADHLAFGQEPTAPAAGAAIDPPVTVVVRDAGGTPVGDAAVAVTLATIGGGTSMTVTSVGGVATFTGFTPAGSGTEQLQATAPGLIAATSSVFSVAPFGADVGVSATAAPASIAADGLVTVTSTVTNAGPDDALAAGVSQTVPANTVVVAAGDVARKLFARIAGGVRAGIASHRRYRNGHRAPATVAAGGRFERGECLDRLGGSLLRQQLYRCGLDDHGRPGCYLCHAHRREVRADTGDGGPEHHRAVERDCRHSGHRGRQLRPGTVHERADTSAGGGLQLPLHRSRPVRREGGKRDQPSDGAAAGAAPRRPETMRSRSPGQPQPCRPEWSRMCS